MAATDDKTTRNETGAIVESGGLGAFVMRPGDCFMAPEEGTELVVSVEGVPCEAPHDGQVYALFDVPDTEIFDEAGVEAQAGEGCMSRWSTELWGTYEENMEIDIFYFTPSSESWAEDDREIVCVIVPLDEDTPLVGSRL
ncbi:MAG TPA: septum formation family protein [Acidimicrobiales bacterium]|nr:septum formation family protein [Acidimicrobiales bacterium]